MNIYFSSVTPLDISNFQKVFSNYFVMHCCCLHCAKYLAQRDIEKYIECMGFGIILPKIIIYIKGIPTAVGNGGLPLGAGGQSSVPQNQLISFFENIPSYQLVDVTYSNGVVSI